MTITHSELGPDFNPDAFELKVGNRFTSGPVEIEERGRFFLKCARDPDNQSQREDLGNEVNWNRTVAPLLPVDASFRVPEVIVTAPDYRWALFEHIDAQPVHQLELWGRLPQLVTILGELQALPLRWDPEGFADHYRSHLERFAHVVAPPWFTDSESAMLQEVMHGSDLSILLPGPAHGDFNPTQNFLLPDRNEKPVLADAEFAAIPEKPAWYKPRFEDAAYLFHLLECQHHRPDLSAELYIMLCERFAEEATFPREFAYSVLERTIRMISHFVVRPKPDMEIKDMRRTDPEPYQRLVVESCQQILA